MSRKNKVKILKRVMTGVVLIVMIGMIAYLFPVMKNLSSMEGQVAFKEKVENSGIFGMLTLFGLQVAQIFLIIVPGEPLEILAGMCYGAVWRNNIYYDFCCDDICRYLWIGAKIWKKFCMQLL